MKIKELLQYARFGKKNGKENPVDQDSDDGEVNKGTKLKVIAALLVVGFAVYTAWWVQEPGAARADNMYPEMTQIAAGTAETTENSVEVSIIDFSFDPAEISIEKGTTVVWTNKDTVPHTVTGSSFSSGTLDRGQSFSYTFNDDATYEYHCSFHPQMTGKIIAGMGGSTMASTEELFPAATGETEEAAMPLIPGGEILTPETGEVILPVSMLAENLTPEEIVAQTAAAEETVSAEAHAAAEENKKLAKSGPEDFLYAGIFLAILLLNRRKLFPALR